MQTTLVCQAIIDDKRYAACQCQLPRTQARLMANYGKTCSDAAAAMLRGARCRWPAGGAFACVLVDSAYETRAWHAHQLLCKGQTETERGTDREREEGETCRQRHRQREIVREADWQSDMQSER